MCSLKADDFVWTNPKDHKDKKFEMGVDVCENYLSECSPLWIEIKRLLNTFNGSHSFREFRDHLDLISKSISINDKFWKAIQ